MAEEHEFSGNTADDDGNGSGPARDKGKGKSHEHPKQELAEIRQKAEEYLADLKRERADFLNYKKRIEQERAELTQNANRSLVLRILPAFDDLERALRHIPVGITGETAAWVDGIVKISEKFKSTLASEGITQIESEGADFDTSLHEAVGHEYGGEEGKVLHEVQKGYKIKDKLLRAAQVIVSKGPENKQEG